MGKGNGYWALGLKDLGHEFGLINFGVGRLNKNIFLFLFFFDFKI